MQTGYRNGDGEQTSMPAQDESFGATRLGESASGAPPSRSAATPAETALEWLTGERTDAATTVEDQFR